MYGVLKPGWCGAIQPGRKITLMLHPRLFTAMLCRMDIGGNAQASYCLTAIARKPKHVS